MSGWAVWVTERAVWTSGKVPHSGPDGYLCRKTKTMFLKISLFSMALSVLAVFCKNPEKTRVAENDFYVRFIEDNSTVMATAAFRAGEAGTKLAPRSMTKVFFQDFEMGERQTGDLLRYVTEQKVPGFESAYEFRWKNDANASLKHKLRLAPILRVTVPQPWPTTDIAAIKWAGGPLDAAETLTILCENKNGETYSQEFRGPTDLGAVPLNAKKIGKGLWTATLIKTRIEEKTEGSVTTKSVFEFYAAPVAFEVK